MQANKLWVVLAFATVYLVWGSTYFFIQMGIQGFPPLLLGALRFLIAGSLLLGWCALKGERIWQWRYVKHAAVSGILMLFVALGLVMWAEQSLPSGVVAILVSSSPLWFVLLDRAKWQQNLRDRATILGLLTGFAGVALLFGEQFLHDVKHVQILPMLLLLVSTIAWSAGSLYSKYKLTGGAAPVNTAWQMLAAAALFVPCALLHGDVQQLHWAQVPVAAWSALIYLIIFGSIAAFSAYVWLLQVRPATQVSTYAYVNPVIAVLLGLFFGHEPISLLQMGGLLVILTSVLLLNLQKYRALKPAAKLGFI